jgi:hypothetical protein
VIFETFLAYFRECPKGEVPRILIPRTPVNKSKKWKGRGVMPRPFTLRLSRALYFFGLIVYEEQMVEVPPCPCLAAF